MKSNNVSQEQEARVVHITRFGGAVAGYGGLWHAPARMFHEHGRHYTDGEVISLCEVTTTSGEKVVSRAAGPDVLAVGAQVRSPNCPQCSAMLRRY